MTSVNVERLCIIDAYVVFHNIVNRAFEAYGELPEGFVAYAEAALEWVDSLAWFPGLQKRGCKSIWAVDKKPYWRSDYHPDYKAGRLIRPRLNLAELYAAFERLEFRALTMPSYEADDIAGALVHMWQAGQMGGIRQLFLATCDSDWQGLVCQPDVFWVDLAGHTPRVRQRQEIYDWLVSKWKKQTIFERSVWTPPDIAKFESRQIWDWKREAGDKSDNLPCRSPLYLIDLFAPPPDYRLWEDSGFCQAVRSELDRERTPQLELSQAENQMSMLGLNPPISAIDEFNPILFTPCI